MSKCLDIRNIETLLNVRFTCKRLNLSCTIHLNTPIQSKIGSKILSQNYVKTRFYRHFSSLKLFLGPSTSLIQKVLVSMSSLTHNYRK